MYKRQALNWTNSDKRQPYSYMLYSKSAHESTFQSIPSKEHVNVLNIYPDKQTDSWGVSGTVSFISTLDGKSYTLLKSASLKMWMEAANSDNSHGYGKGFISVDAVSFTDFNANPNFYLKGSSGSYKYDVVFFGAWDGYSNEDISASTETAVEAYVNTGRGLLIGHDLSLIHICCFQFHPQGLELTSSLALFLLIPFRHFRKPGIVDLSSYIVLIQPFK